MWTSGFESSRGSQVVKAHSHREVGNVAGYDSRTGRVCTAEIGWDEAGVLSLTASGGDGLVLFPPASAAWVSQATLSPLPVCTHTGVACVWWASGLCWPLGLGLLLPYPWR